MPYDPSVHGADWARDPLQGVAGIRAAGNVTPAANIAYGELQLGGQTIPLGGLSGYAKAIHIASDGTPRWRLLPARPKAMGI